MAAKVKAKVKEKEVWVAVRKDTAVGVGTKLNPYNVSGRERFDFFMYNLPTGVRVNFYPGIYETRGSSFYHLTRENQWFVKSGQKFVGAGEGQTIIKLNLNSTDIQAETFYNAFVGPSGIDLPNVEIRDLTIDCDFRNQPTGNLIGVGAWYLAGSYFVADNVNIVNWGTTCKTKKTYIACLTEGYRSYYENIRCFNPVSVISGAKACSVLGVLGGNNSEITISKCLVDGSITGNQALSLDGHPYVDWTYPTIGVESNGKKCIVDNCTFKHIYAGGPYIVSGSMGDLTVKNCIYANVYNGIVINPEISGRGVIAAKIHDNIFYLAFKSGIPETGGIRGVYIQNTRDTAKPNGLIMVYNNDFMWYEGYMPVAADITGLRVIFLGSATGIVVENNLSWFPPYGNHHIYARDYKMIWHRSNRKRNAFWSKVYDLNTSAELTWR